MSNKKEKKNTAKTLKKTPKNRKTLMLKLDNGVEVPARTVYVKDNIKCFKFNDVEINKIRVSEQRLYSKQHNAYKYYVIYEHDNEYIPLRVTLKDVVGYYDVYNDSKKMNFKINDGLSDEPYHKLTNIFSHIEEKLNITFNDFTFKKKGEEYFKIKVSNETCFKADIKSTLILKEGKVIPEENKTICFLQYET